MAPVHSAPNSRFKTTTPAFLTLLLYEPLRVYIAATVLPAKRSSSVAHRASLIRASPTT